MNTLLPCTHKELGIDNGGIGIGGPITTAAKGRPGTTLPNKVRPGLVNTPLPNTSGIPGLLKSRLPIATFPVSICTFFKLIF